MERKSINFNFYSRFINGKSSFSDYRNYEIIKFKIYYKFGKSLLEIIIYDSIGEKKYSSVHKEYYKKAESIILVYDINDKNTFESCNTFIEIINKKCKRNRKKLMLIGNKSDIENKREVSEEQRLNFKFLNRCESFETSCENKENTHVNYENISKAFETLIKITINEIISSDFNEFKKKD